MQKTSIKGIKDIPRTSSSGDQGDCTTVSQRPPTIEVQPQSQKFKIDQFKKQKQIRRVPQTMGTQRNNPQSKGKEESSERMLNEIDRTQLLDIEFKTIIKKPNELSANYQNLQGNYQKLAANYITKKEKDKEIKDKWAKIIGNPKF